MNPVKASQVEPWQYVISLGRESTRFRPLWREGGLAAFVANQRPLAQSNFSRALLIREWFNYKAMS
jgi:hypothetical protein